MSEEEKRKVRRSLAIASLRQLKRLLQDQLTTTWAVINAENIATTMHTLDKLIERIEKDKIGEREWAFLSFLANEGLKNGTVPSAAVSSSTAKTSKPATKSRSTAKKSTITSLEKSPS